MPGATIEAMRLWHALCLVALCLRPVTTSAEGTTAPPPAASVHLRGLSDAEATALISKLQEAQRRLRTGDEKLFFELVAGSLASYEMTKVSPREAFLQVAFEKAWSIERVPTQNRLWQPYKLAYAPNGLGQLYWEIEVVMGFYGQIERVSMIYKPPAPF
jgi:hypothetical protein